jgi:hypothetical protein
MMNEDIEEKQKRVRLYVEYTAYEFLNLLYLFRVFI